MFKYLIIPKEGTKFFTNYFSTLNHWIEGMVVINCVDQTEFNGEFWEEIELDHL